MLKVKLFGACGYGGVGMIELLLRHPGARIVKLIDKENCGVTISSVYPHLKGFCDMRITSPEEDDPADEEANALFFATPDGVAMKMATGYLENGLKVVDFSGDFRFPSITDYALYAQRIGRPTEHLSPGLLSDTVYGITEINRKAISGARLVGNPGCFAMATILGLAPVVKAKAVNLKGLICDAKTGVSGAGKKPAPTFHYPARYENMNPYKIGAHQHTIEIEGELSRMAGQECLVTLTTQVLPITRGIMACAYGQLDANWDSDRVNALYNEFYKKEPFIRVLPQGVPPASANVRGSNFCLLSTYVDKRNGTCCIFVQIDNLVKGQAGSALQNMNLMLGMDETLGLYHPSMVP